MAKIIDISGGEVAIADDENKITRLPIATVQYSNPRIGDQVTIYKDGKQKIVKPSRATAPTGARSINKHVFVWVGCLLFGWVGADRHMRGQHGLGILKLAVTTVMPVVIAVAFIVALFSSPFYERSTMHCDPDYQLYSSSYYDSWYYDDYEDDDDYYYHTGNVPKECVEDFYGEFDYYDPFYDEADSVLALIFFLIMPMTAFSFAGGIWCLVDWIIALIKVYGSNNHSDEISFDERGHYLV